MIECQKGVNVQNNGICLVFYELYTKMVKAHAVGYVPKNAYNAPENV
jgi:hypothetical protein